jgi:DNA helicase HerA-like ATPase
VPLISRHVAVIAKTGMGKSYTVGVLIEELLKRHVAIVIMDPHGEYTSIAYQNDNKQEMRKMRKFDVNPRGYFHLFNEFSPDPICNPAATALRFDEKNLDYDDIINLTTIGESDAQCAMLERTLYTLQRLKREPTIQHMIETIDRERTLAKYRLIRELRRLQSMPIFDFPPTKIYEIVKPGRIAVINFKGVDEDMQAWCAGKISKRIFDRAKEGGFPPVFIVIEEAHRFIPEGTRTVASKALSTAASEGRKFGVGLCIISQRVAKVSKNVLSQCGCHIIHCLTSAADLVAVSSSLEGWTAEMNDEVQRLPIGVALVSADSLPHPIVVEIRPRETRHGGARKELVPEG